MRSRLEHALRAIVIAALAAMLWQSLHRQSGGGQVVRSTSVNAQSLADLSALPTAPTGIQLRLTSVPSMVEGAWLGALAAAGSNVAWRGDLPATMIGAEPIASPSGGARVNVSAPNGASVILRDELGAIDTLRVQNGGVSVSLRSMSATLTASLKGATASAPVRDSLALRRVMVIGAAGWESKFVVAALEEDGWKVDAELHLAPGIDVAQGARSAIDTSRYSAVVALDAAAAPFANGIVDFVHSGGGLILAPAAASLDAFSPLRAGAVGRVAPNTAIAQAGAVDRTSLPLAPLTSLRGDAVAIERRGPSIAIAALRVGAGRVLQLGYEDTWRWRMAGGDQSVREHRQWWTDRVSSVAHASMITRERNAVAPIDPAPLASLVSALGPSSVVEASAGFATARLQRMLLLFTVLALALIAEVASRRLRGAS
jgi:hypothetical protein